MQRPRCDLTAMGSAAALSLIELLFVLGTVSVLVVLLAGGGAILRQRGDVAAATNNLRQVGVATALYAAEHDRLLPGPLWPGQIPVANSGRPGRLADFLAPYLGVQADGPPVRVDVLIPPAYCRVVPDRMLDEARTFVINTAVELNDGEEQVVQPFGNLATGNQTVLFHFQIPGTAWALSDADQLHPRVAAASWASHTPASSIHGRQRMGLRFDGTVGGVSPGELIVPE